MVSRRILLVEDERLTARIEQKMLVDLGYDVVAIARSAEDALDRVGEMRPDVILMDIMLMGPMDGIEVAELVSERFGTPVVFLSAQEDDDFLHRASGVRVGSYGYLLKPASKAEMFCNIEMAVLRKAMENQLEADKEDLEAFTYSASHDLKAPIRAIEGLSQAVMEDYGHLLDDQGLEYLEHLYASSKKMKRMVDDLLQLSRATRAKLNAQEVDLSFVARQAIEDLRMQDMDRSVTVKISPEIKVFGDPGLLATVMENLLGNAWKYTSNVSAAEIEIGTELWNGGRVVFVRDNGVGFNMDFAEKLFQPFQRLHTDVEFEGSGIGLSTVKRIVGRHGGRVWGEGIVGQGAIFRFELGDLTPEKVKS